MEFLPNGIELEIPTGAFPLSTDSMALAHFAALTGSRSVLDLGSGCGTLGLLLCARESWVRVMGLELNPAAHTAALANIRRNSLEHRMESICADLRQVNTLFPPGSFDCCISNPPYFSGGPSSRIHGAARREDACTLGELMTSAGYALKYGGDFFLVHRPERLGEIIARAAENGMEAKRLGLVRHRPGTEPSLILLQLRKGGKPGLRWEDWILHEQDGSPTSLYREIYHLEEA